MVGRLFGRLIDSLMFNRFLVHFFIDSSVNGLS